MPVWHDFKQLLSITISCILWYGYTNFSNYSFVCKPTECAFRNEGGENPLAIAIEAWDLVVSKPMRDMGF